MLLSTLRFPILELYQSSLSLTMVCFFWAKSSIFTFMFPLRCCRGSFSTSFLTFGEGNEIYQQITLDHEQPHLMSLNRWTSENTQIYQRKARASC